MSKRKHKHPCNHVWEELDDNTEICFECNKQRKKGRTLMDIFSEEDRQCPPVEAPKVFAK